MKRPSKGKILFVLNPVLGHVTVYLRGLIFKDMLLRNGWEATFVNSSTETLNNELDELRKSESEIINLAKENDVVYLLKVNSLDFVSKLKKLTQAKIVFELTDALWRPSFRLQGWFHLEEILQTADAIFSENEFVCEFGRRFNKNVYSLTACTQTEKFEMMRERLTQRNADKTIIGWIGSKDTISAIFSIIKPLKKLFSKYPFLELRILGCDAEVIRKRLKGISYTSMPSYNENDMIKEALCFDIGLFPAPAGAEDYKIRGALKGMIYMAAGKPAVCLNLGDCSKIIKDGLNGVLINSDDEWETKIERLILDPLLRKNIGKLAFETIKEEHSLDYAFKDLEKALLQVCSLKPGQATNVRLSSFRLALYKFKIVFLMGLEATRRGFRKLEIDL